MQRPIKIGFVSPYSTIYPSLNQNIMDGILCGLSPKIQNHFQFVPEFVRQGEPGALKPALEKLLTFDNVDILTGLVGYRSIVEHLPLIERTKKVALFADMGEYIPFDGLTSDYLFFNSFQFWQAEFALGHWAQSTFGGRGSVFMPVYEAGYHMHSVFRQGALTAENTQMEYATMRFSQSPDHSVTEALEEYMQKFKKERPTYIHALFSGSEAVEFFASYHKHGLHKEIPLIVSPHMASYEVLREIEHLDMTIYAASLWNFHSDDLANTLFRQRHIQRTGEMANIFSLLGYEIGMALDHLYPSLNSRDWDSVKKYLKEERIQTPRGERNFYLNSNYATPIIDIEKIKIENGKVNKMITAQGKSLEYNHYIFDEIHHENQTGWYNSYLCV